MKNKRTRKIKNNNKKKKDKTNMKNPIINKIIEIAKDTVLSELERKIKDPEIQKKIVDISPLPIAAKDLIKETFDLVNKHSMDESIQIAIESCTFKNKEAQQEVTAFISALYQEHHIKRAAQVGGSLLKRFGPLYFPKIKEKELRFAIEVNKELELFYLEEIKNQWNNL